MGKDLNGKELGIGISQRADGSYMARAQCYGVPICLYGRNYQKLKKELEEQKRLAKENHGKVPKQYTLSEWFDIWFTTYKEPAIGEQSVQPMKSNSKIILDRLGDKKIADIKPIEVQQILNDLVSEDKYARSSITESHNRLKSCLDSAIHNGYIKKNPFSAAMLPGTTEKDTSKDEIRFLDTAQIKEFLDFIADTWWYECFYVMIYTGLRIGEVGGLQWSDIDFENKCVRVAHGLQCYYKNKEKVIKLGPPKTSYSYRTIPFIGDVETMFIRQREKLEKYKKQYGGKIALPEDMQNLVFLTQKVTPVTRYPAEHVLVKITKNLNLKRAYDAAKAGVEYEPFISLHPHALRHTFCSLCYEAGVDVKACQALMGHASITTTMNIYTHLSKQKMHVETKKLNELIKAEPVKS